MAIAKINLTEEDVRFFVAVDAANYGRISAHHKAQSMLYRFQMIDTQNGVRSVGSIVYNDDTSAYWAKKSRECRFQLIGDGCPEEEVDCEPLEA